MRNSPHLPTKLRLPTEFFRPTLTPHLQAGFQLALTPYKLAKSTEAPDFDPSRPFTCPECGSRYTRQEHLDRHVTAKHRVAKDFICPICSKGFARKDILKRHQAGHEKQQAAAAEAAMRGERLDDDDARSTASSTKSKKKRPVAQTPSDITVEDAGGPVKIARVGRACCRCSKSKLRCDGQQPCERCRKANIDCSFDRPAKGPHSRSGSVSMIIPDDMQHTPSMDSDGDTSPENAFSLPALPTPPPADQWTRTGVAQAGMSLYNMPFRGPPPHGHALPPSSFLQNPSPVNYYSGRPPESSYYRNPSPYHTSTFASLNLPHHNPSPLNPYGSNSTSALPGAPAGPSTSHWDSGAYGRQIAAESESSSSDFLGLVSDNGTSNDIDWNILGSLSQDPLFNRTGFTPRDGMSPAPSGGGNVDLNLLTSALTAPSQPVSDLRNGGSGDEAGASSSFEPEAEDEEAVDDEEDEEMPDRPPPSHRTNSVVESDRAAVSLLQLASHTPRVSPEPQAGQRSSSRPSFPRGQFSLLNPLTEEALRTSHPSACASPADSPWPLSYRPTEATEEILPASARGTGYFSRATSPPAHHASLSHVPSVTDSTRLRILYKVRELTQLDHTLSERFVPRLELLELFIQLYFEKLHALFPLVHKPTWDPNSAPSFLVLAIASVGARYAHERVVGASMHAHALLEASRRMAQIMGDLDNTLPRTVAWQQTLLIVLQSGIFSGNKRDLERTQAFASMPVTYARRQGWFKELKVDEAAEELLPLDDRWKRWRNREEIRRLGFGAVVFDCTGTALWNLESLSLYLDAANTPLPCHDSLWDAPSSAAWSTLFRHTILPPPSPTLSSAIQLICSPSTSSSSPNLTPILRDAFALNVVLNVLSALSWARGHAKSVERTFLTPPPSSSSVTSGAGENGLLRKKEEEEERRASEEGDAALAALEAGLDFYHDRVLLPPDLLARLEHQDGASGTGMALLVHLTAVMKALPVRVLQPLARSADVPLPPATASALRVWATTSHGSLARKTAYHAGQLLALCRSSSTTSSASMSSSSALHPASESPFEPFAVFYATLALVAFVRESKEGAAKPEDQPPVEIGEPIKDLYLDQLRDRSEEDLQAWIHSGPLSASSLPFSSVSTPSLRLHTPAKPPQPAVQSSTPPSSATARSFAHLVAALGRPPPLPSTSTSSLTETVKLDAPELSEKLLASAVKRLTSCRTWKVGEGLAAVLEGLLEAEREGGREGERVKGEEDLTV